MELLRGSEYSYRTGTYFNEDNPCPNCGCNDEEKIIRGKKVYCFDCYFEDYKVCGECNKEFSFSYIKSYTNFPLTNKYIQIFKNSKTKRVIRNLCLKCFKKKEDEMKSIEQNSCVICGSAYSTFDPDLKILLCSDCKRLKYTCDLCNKVHLNYTKSGTKRTKKVFSKKWIYSTRHKDYTFCSSCKADIESRKSTKFGFCSYCGFLEYYSDLNYMTASSKNFPILLCSTCNTLRNLRFCTIHDGFYESYAKDPNQHTCLACARELGILKTNLVCEVCGDPANNHYFKEKKTNKYICRKCIKENCSVSRASDPEPSYHVDDYNFVPDIFYYHTKNKDTLLFGIENEIYCESREQRNNFLKNLYTNFDETYLYTKFDGSIEGRNGFEIVTHPMSYDFLMKDFKVDLLTYNKTRNHTCGMHIHSTKSFYDRPTIFKLYDFFNKNKKFISFIAEREMTSYSLPIENYDNIYKTSISKSNYGFKRYSQINLANSKTLEIRIFAQAIDPQTYLKNIQFAESISIFCKGVGFKNNNIEEYFLYLDRYKDKYKLLYGFILDKIKIFLPRKKIKVGKICNIPRNIKPEKTKVEQRIDAYSDINILQELSERLQEIRRPGSSIPRTSIEPDWFSISNDSNT